MSNLYFELKERQQEQFNNFPMFFAFDKKQFEEGKQKLGVKENKELCTIGSGGYIRKSDKDEFINMLSRQEKELQDKIKEDKVGDKFIYDMFLYEMANHEYIISLDIGETLEALNLTFEDVMNDKALSNGLILAKDEYFRSYEVM